MNILKILAAAFLSFVFLSCAVDRTSSAGHAPKPVYVWQEITRSAGFPEGYNYPVFVMDGEMRALNNGGGWVSKDGKSWTKTALGNTNLNSAYQSFVQFKDAVYALGAMEGNYTKMRLSSKISRTRDFQTWETLTETSNLPARVFYGALVFKDRIWLFGGWDGKNYHNDVWNSADGVNWQRVAETTAWTPRTARGVIVFKDRLWLFGGGVLDGDEPNNPNAGREVWSSADGVNWTPVEIRSPRPLGGTLVVFDDKLWMVGANRASGDFGSAVFVSADGADWQELAAPWTPRGAVAAWVYGGRLFMTGGKYSYKEPNGEIKFVYSNDVWAMSREEAER